MAGALWGGGGAGRGLKEATIGVRRQGRRGSCLNEAAVGAEKWAEGGEAHAVQMGAGLLRHSCSSTATNLLAEISLFVILIIGAFCDEGDILEILSHLEKASLCVGEAAIAN